MQLNTNTINTRARRECSCCSYLRLPNWGKWSFNMPHKGIRDSQYCILWKFDLNMLMCIHGNAITDRRDL